MPKLRGFFDTFAHADEISPEMVLKWLGPKANLQSVTNYLGNRFLYPQIIPQTAKELAIDLALLREIIKLNPQDYYDHITRRIFIPTEALSYFPDPVKLVLAFVDALPLTAITTVWEKGNKLNKAGVGALGSVGVIVTPDKVTPNQKFTLTVSDTTQTQKPQTVEIKTGSIMAIPVYYQNVSLHFNSQEVTLHGEHDLKTQSASGVAGIIVDSRIK